MNSKPPDLEIENERTTRERLERDHVAWREAGGKTGQRRTGDCEGDRDARHREGKSPSVASPEESPPPPVLYNTVNSVK